MNKTVKTWFTIAVSTAVGAALGMMLKPGCDGRCCTSLTQRDETKPEEKKKEQ